MVLQILKKLDAKFLWKICNLIDLVCFVSAFQDETM